MAVLQAYIVIDFDERNRYTVTNKISGRGECDVSGISQY